MPRTTLINNPAALANYTEAEIWREPYSNRIFLNEGVSQRGNQSWYSQIQPPQEPEAPVISETPAAAVARTPRFPDFTPNTDINDYYQRLFSESKQPVDEAGIRKQMLDAVQAQLDSINSIYDNILANVKIQGTGRLGQQRAISARKGTIGSEMGQAQKTEVETYNTQQEQAVQAERSAKLTSILSNAQTRADEKIALERQTRDKKAAEYIDYLKGQKDEAKADIKTLAATGLTLDKISDDQYIKLLKDSGFQSETEFEAYYNAGLPKNKQVKYEYKELKDGTLLRIGDDGSYKAIDEFKLPTSGNWTITQLDDGTVIAYDRDQGTEDGKFSFETIGKYAKAKATGTGTSSTLKLSTGQKSKLARLFNSAEINDLEAAVNAIGVDGVLENVTDESERKLIEDVFGTIEDTNVSQQDQNLKDLGYSAADIREYKKAQAEATGITIEPRAFLQQLKKKKASGDSTSFVDDWLKTLGND